MTGYVGPIDTLTLQNAYFRQIVFTATHAQLVVMCLQPREAIGEEMHANVDKFFRIEQGEATVVFNGQEEHQVHEGDGALVPAGTHHNVINSSAVKLLKLYTIYSPPNHLEGTVHRTKADVDAAEVPAR